MQGAAGPSGTLWHLSNVSLLSCRALWHLSNVSLLSCRCPPRAVPAQPTTFSASKASSPSLATIRDGTPGLMCRWASCHFCVYGDGRVRHDGRAPGHCCAAPPKSTMSHDMISTSNQRLYRILGLLGLSSRHAWPRTPLPSALPSLPMPRMLPGSPRIPSR